MHFRPFLFAIGLGSAVAACSSDSNNGSSADGGNPEGGAGGGHATGGNTSSSGGSGTGGSSSGGASIDGGAGSTGTGGAEADGGDAGGVTGPIEHVFLIAMENHDLSEVVGDTANAPYINNTLIKGYASTSNFNDVLDLIIPSEPHYVLVEAGTTMFSDPITFTGDGEPASGNSTSSTEHLATQMKTAQVSWMSYQQGMDATSGDCPIHSSGYYMPKHDPFIFFQDVSGSPPSTTEAYCVAHHKELTKLDDDLKNDQVASYNFITPDQCNDMHGQGGCPNSNAIRAGDDWLKGQLKTLLPYANTHHGVIFVFWDEGTATLKVPFLAIGPNVKKNYVGGVSYTHRSITKTIEKIFGLPYLDTVKSDNDLSDLFEAGKLP
jgi:hypothetical protein